MMHESRICNTYGGDHIVQTNTIVLFRIKVAPGSLPTYVQNTVGLSKLANQVERSETGVPEERLVNASVDPLWFSCFVMQQRIGP